MNTVVMPARSAANSFSFRPPIGSTRPRSVISPVIATSRRIGMPVRMLTIESVMLPGKGNVKTTGKLGDVMQESVSAALS
jgi:hypothetical protein